MTSIEVHNNQRKFLISINAKKKYKAVALLDEKKMERGTYSKGTKKGQKQQTINVEAQALQKFEFIIRS